MGSISLVGYLPGRLESELLLADFAYHNAAFPLHLHYFLLPGRLPLSNMWVRTKAQSLLKSVPVLCTRILKRPPNH